MTEKLYKILENGKSCHGGDLKWSLPQGNKPGAWHEIAGDLALCQNGIHLTDKPAKWFRWNCSIYEAQYDGDILWDRNESKCCVRKARLVKELPPPKWWINAHNFVERDIPSVRWLVPDLKPREKWKFFKGKTWAAARDAARDAAWNAARDAAWNAAWNAARDATWAAARDAARDAAWNAARDAAWDAARDAAWNVARDAAWDAAWDATWAAARDAASMARLAVVSDLKIDKKHITHIKQRWEVWQKGYALLCDINGILYVYAKE